MQMRCVLFTIITSVFSTYSQTVVERGPHTSVVESVREAADANQTKVIKSHYTVLQPGLNYFSVDDRTWKPTSTQIDLDQVGASYSKGPFKLKFSPNANDEVSAVALTLPDGRAVKIKTLGVALTSLNGDSVWLGEVRDSNGLLGGNTVVYPDAFDGLKADIIVKVSVGKYESDVILREQVIAPQTFGFDPATSTLEIWHKIVEAPVPEVATAKIARQNGIIDTDQQLGFGEMIIGEGAAFLVGPDKAPLSTQDGAIRVSKERFDDANTNTKYLIERIPYAEASAHLQTLPARAEAFLDKNVIQRRIQNARTRNVAQRSGRSVPVSVASIKPLKTGHSDRKVATLTRGNTQSTPGFMIDYSVLVGISGIRFRGDTTYYCTNQVDLIGRPGDEGGTGVKVPSYNGVS